MIIALVGSQFAVWARLGEIAGHAYRAMARRMLLGLRIRAL
jgi:hypothetical protein